MTSVDNAKLQSSIYSKDKKRLRRELERLEGEKNYLQLSVADLESEYSSGDLTALDYETLKSDYSQRLEKVLTDYNSIRLKLESLSGDVVFSEGPLFERKTNFAGGSIRKILGQKKTRKYLFILLIFSVIAAGISAAYSFSADRLPGQFATGSVALTKQALIRQQLLQAQVLGSEGHLRSAITLYAEVLQESKGNPTALSYQGWLIRLIGKSSDSKQLVEEGDRQIDSVVKKDPGYANAHAFYAIALLQDSTGGKSAVASQLNDFLQDHPTKQFLAVLGTQVISTYRALHIPLPGELIRYKSALK